MSDSKKVAPPSAQRAGRLPYHAPELQHHGSTAELTGVIDVPQGTDGPYGDNLTPPTSR